MALLAAILVAAHSPVQSSAGQVFGTYFYWISRIAAEALLFFVVRTAVEAYAPKSLGFGGLTALAIAISHVPFVLSVTALDIVLGYPELGIEVAQAGQSRIAATGRELFFLADNHIALCLLLSLPRLIAQATQVAAGPYAQISSPTFLGALDPPLEGDVLWVEAQEHYVNITTAAETRLVLARFSDVVRELPADAGMQVHRSHWVRTSAIASHSRKGQNLQLRLTNDATVPVSRSYKQQVLAALPG